MSDVIEHSGSSPCSLPLVGQRYKWPVVGEVFEILEVQLKTVDCDGESYTHISVRISDVGWVPWCNGNGFVLISNV